MEESHNEKRMIPITRPTLPPLGAIQRAIATFYETGMITNGYMVNKLEEKIQDSFNIGCAIAVSSCTNGLMLALRCLGLKGKVALPSFTFFATAHAVVWNDLEPVFVDVSPETWNMSAGSLARVLNEANDISAVVPVHIFGNPCDTDSLKAVAEEYNLKILYDSAHAIGAKTGDGWVGGFGNAEVFSLTPTKLVAAGEGGIITTNDEELAEALRAGRNYGNKGDYDPRFVGLSARLSEFHAALGIESFRLLQSNIRHRNKIAGRYKENLAKLPGVSFQVVKEGNLSTFKDFTILIEESQFGVDRDILSWYLATKGIDTRKYFFPPVHRTSAYWERWGRSYDDALSVTNKLSLQALSLPIWSHMEESIVDEVTGEIMIAHEKAEEIKLEYTKAVEK